MYRSRSRNGTLAVLRTKGEVQASFQSTEAWVSLIPAKSANDVCKSLDHELQSHDALNLQHLRRFVKPEHLYASLGHIAINTDNPFNAVVDTSPCRPNECLTLANNDLDSAGASTSDSLYLLLCANSDLSRDKILALLSEHGLRSTNDWAPALCTVSVPLLPPTSEQEAIQWSQQFWPTIYKRHNSFGPHPALVSQATEEVRKRVGEYMGLAASVAQETYDADFGECIGAVITSHDQSTELSVIAVAGDARWHKIHRKTTHGKGNAMAHAVMRAIGMVALKRHGFSNADDLQQNHFEDRPLTGLENTISAASSLAPGGYLCLDLDLYMTHEPCVMCSMAILHSRFRRVVFARRMKQTGGLSAEMGQEEAIDGLGYGIFSRPSFNWKFLTWQWLDDEDPAQKNFSERTLHA